MRPLRTIIGCRSARPRPVLASNALRSGVTGIENPSTESSRHKVEMNNVIVHKQFDELWFERMLKVSKFLAEIFMATNPGRSLTRNIALANTQENSWQSYSWQIDCLSWASSPVSILSPIIAYRRRVCVGTVASARLSFDLA
jgi:hypothetical protein